MFGQIIYALFLLAFFGLILFLGIWNYKKSRKKQIQIQVNESINVEDFTRKWSVRLVPLEAGKSYFIIIGNHPLKIVDYQIFWYIQGMPNTGSNPEKFQKYAEEGKIIISETDAK